MKLPYIKLSQKVEASTLDLIIEQVWNEVSDETKQAIIDYLKIDGVEYEQDKF